MVKSVKIIKYGIFMLVIGRIFDQISAFNLGKSKSSSDSAQSSTESQSEQQQNEFKTTFDGDLVNLDINCLQGYSKFNCTISSTEVVYQSSNKFKSALDGENPIWKADNTNAFRFTLQFLDKIPLTLMVEFDRNDKSNALYYRKRCKSTEWDKIDDNTHNKFVEDFKNKLKEYKEGIKKGTDEAVDLNLKIENSTEVKFEFHDYKNSEEKVSGGTEAAKTKKENITNSQYKLNNNSVTDGTGKVEKRMILEITDKKYRIVQVSVKSKVGISCDAWKTGGTTYCTNMLGKWEDDNLKEIILTLTYKDSGKKTELKLKASPSWKWLYNFEESKETDLPTIDFEY